MKISIIIPTIGRSSLERVIKALMKNKNFVQIKPEILVIFDGKKSRKRSFPILESKFVRVFETGEKVYSSGARNFGIEKARGDILIFIGDDTIPDKNWLWRVVDFHEKFPKPEYALLGKISWFGDLAQDPFHQWLEENAQFDFGRLKKGNKLDWRHFYTSNISFKRKFLADERFSMKFKRWGFEDSELGYRLWRRGMELHFDRWCEVLHDDPQTVVRMVKRTREARVNAKVFESLHPSLKILPHGVRLFMLKILVHLSTPFARKSKRLHWWRLWKQAWIGE
jgi:glycosyltransferase involved in cell wall biosynthesis